MTSSQIQITDLRKSYDQTLVIPGLSARIDSGSFTVILGPSGCGKSTLLNMIAGLEEVSGGTISIGDRAVQDLPPNERGLAMVFQNYALYPHMSVAENIGYSLKIAKVPKAERASRVAEAARVVSLSDYLERRPGQLSGGQRQRVAIARAIVREPAVLLFDEPLSNLDAKLRHGMRMELAELHKRIGATSVFVTHDQVEAMTLADKIMVLNQGRIEQYGTPAEIYHSPASVFVAEFIGAPPMNLMNVTGQDGWLCLSDGTRIAPSAFQGAVRLGIRPEHVIATPPQDGGPEAGGLKAQVVYREDLGSHRILLLRLPSGDMLRVSGTPGSESPEGDALILEFPTRHLHLFDMNSGHNIPNQESSHGPATT